MAPTVDGTIPPELMDKARKSEVIAFIRALHVLPSQRRQLLARWAYIVGAEVTGDELRYVQVTQR